MLSCFPTGRSLFKSVAASTSPFLLAPGRNDGHESYIEHSAQSGFFSDSVDMF